MTHPRFYLGRECIVFHKSVRSSEDFPRPIFFVRNAKKKHIGRRLLSAKQFHYLPKPELEEKKKDATCTSFDPFAEGFAHVFQKRIRGRERPIWSENFSRGKGRGRTDKAG